MAQKKPGAAAIFTIALTPFVMVLGNSMLVPILPTMKGKLHLSQFQVSLVITVFSLAAGLIIPAVGYLSDRYGRKRVIIPSLFLYGIGGLISGFAAWQWSSPYWIIIVGRIIQGIGAAGTSPIAMALIGDQFRGGEESKVLGIIESSNGIGKILSPIFGSLLALITWYTVFFSFPVLTFLTALLFWWLIQEKKRPVAKPFPQYMASLRKIFKKEGRWLVPAFLVGATGLFILFGVLFYLSDVLEDRFKIDGVIKGSFLAIPLLGMVTASYITGVKIKQNKTMIRKVMYAGLFLLTLSTGLVTLFKTLTVMIALLTVSAVGIGLLLPCLNTLITGAVERSERGMITSLYGSVRFLGVAFGPPVFGWLMAISHQVLFLSVSGLSLGIFLLSLWLIRPGNQKRGAEGEGTLFTKWEPAS